MSTATRITLADYDRMIAEGKFEGGMTRPRIELIDGELREMSPIGPLHEEFVDLLNRWCADSFPRSSVRVRIQNSIGLPALESAAEPDVACVRERSYAAGRPVASDVLLVIEVADSSLDYDRGEKANQYAGAGVEDYWVVNIPDRCVEVFRKPAREGYGSHETIRAPAQVRPLAFPQVTLAVNLLFPIEAR